MANQSHGYISGDMRPCVGGNDYDGMICTFDVAVVGCDTAANEGREEAGKGESLTGRK